ncbi:MAG: sensor histidine kinase [Deltaproteobacteria bacterium HGW-Deltaproteobacteria-15]|jgi:signal transduction histidine kinase|nr:MAG: sensor histidine kinase [Deltaproteobacteria bacterium HGW-Deltaproteobacteria-15]
MLRSLYSKLALVLLGLFALVGALLVAISVYSTGMYQQEVNQKLNRSLAELIVSERIVMKNSLVDEAGLKDVFSMLMVVNPSIEIYLLDPQGKILAFSAEPGKVKRTRVSLRPITEFLQGGDAFPIFGDDPRSNHGEKIFTAARIPKQGDLQGYLYVILGGETYDTVMQKVQGSYILRLSLWVTLVSLLVAAAAGLVLFGWLTRRLRRLAVAMKAYSDGAAFERLDLPAARKWAPPRRGGTPSEARRKWAPPRRGGTPSEGRRDEIDDLIAVFRRMAGRIEEQVASLRQMDFLRRELVANVSHDLRTPLATLQGYVETLLVRDAVLSGEERRQYLEIAIAHCTRLGKLVADLFALAKLEAEDITVQREPFSIGELVQDVAQKFRLPAEEKSIVITTNAGPELPFVHADIGLIGRVLENLIENALRYTPESGTISILLQPMDRTVSVTVSDTGCGIPEADLPRIFDRFYRGEKSRKDQRGHAGLGLAIVKRILQLHGTDVEVRSTVDTGTSFTFSLPVHPPGS